MIDYKATINFKRAIFIQSKLDFYSRLTFSAKRRKTKLEENKNNILCGVNTFRKKRSKTTRKTSCGIIRDSARSDTWRILDRQWSNLIG